MEKEKKKVVRDHYRVLGLPSGKEGTKLNEITIKKAYKAKALQLHPDKRPNDPNAKDKFQRLQSSYAILIDPKSRKEFDASLLRLDSKPSSEPKKKTSDEPEGEETFSEWYERQSHHDDLFLLLNYIFIIGPMIFPVGRIRAGVLIRLACLFVTMQELDRRQQVDNVWMMVVRGVVRAYNCFKRNRPSPTQATNQGSESHGDDHEDLEDWVMV
ncbi:uncharacterized J domain-containing protein C17A3.05c-like [Argentina anserina]|uniref:uncharacterized J domain-containing protein C17A3.05c-like n=1 Tax=Argentina anserina TaxID=57926 RepID=UPI002176225B|nr:uncharacterized J domain-containing protein C17A3.05c-like [Potentilla anserina]XP_050367434.1 uncharacterized J domain-containing protein C17A3.05c-like [Potentilla anserina]